MKADLQLKVEYNKHKYSLQKSWNGLHLLISGADPDQKFDRLTTGE